MAELNEAMEHVEAGYTTPEAAKKLNLAFKMEEKGMASDKIDAMLDKAAALEAEGK